MSGRQAPEALSWALKENGVVWHFSVVDSTQEATKRAFAALPQPPAWGVCIAESQTAGRGRQGHAWLSATGQGLWFSLIVPAAASTGNSPPPIALLAADALRVTLVAAGFAVGIKWPNDLWLNEAKVGGVLVESWRHRGDAYWIVGVGLNWNAPAPAAMSDKLGAASAVTGLFDGAQMPLPDRAQLTRRIITALRDGLMTPVQWPVRLAALQENHLLWQRRISAWDQGKKIAEGRAGTLTATGELILITDAGDSVILGGSASVRVTP